jgi:hypothetical protein
MAINQTGEIYLLSPPQNHETAWCPLNSDAQAYAHACKLQTAAHTPCALAASPISDARTTRCRRAALAAPPLRSLLLLHARRRRRILARPITWRLHRWICAGHRDYTRHLQHHAAQHLNGDESRWSTLQIKWPIDLLVIQSAFYSIRL